MIYDSHRDTLTLILKEAPIFESNEDNWGSPSEAAGDLSSVEVLTESKTGYRT